MFNKISYFIVPSIFVLVFCFDLTVFAQNKLADTILLPTIQIGSNRQTFNTGYSVLNISQMLKKEYAANSLAGLLAEQTALTVNTYGAVGLSSLSIRGTGASHTAVIWNGINLQSTMNGGVDLSLLSCQMFDQVSIQLGGASAMFGSGAMGGTVFLNNESEIDKGFEVNLAQYFGSFGFRNSLVSIKLGVGSFSSSTKIAIFKTDNNFSFHNLLKENTPLDTVRNSGQKQWSILQTLAWKVSANNKIAIHAWLLKSEYQIAQTMSQTSLASSEDNHNLRLVASWENKYSIFSNTARVSYVKDVMDYYSYFGNSTHEPSTKSVELESKIQFNDKQELNVGLQSLFERAVSTSYAGIKDRNRYSLFVLYKHMFKKFEFGLNSRAEMVGNNFIPFTASLGAEYKILKQMSLRATLSRNYKLPSFNDLYWARLGNPDLKPEKAWCSDFGLQLKNESEPIFYQFKLNGFSNWVQDMIVWLPDDQNVWHPMNHSFVWSRGLELLMNAKLKLNKLTFGTNFSYNYTLANKKDDIGNYNSNQLIYIPKHELSFDVYVSHRNFKMAYYHKIESIRNYSENGKDRLDGHGIGNLSINTNLILKSQTIGLGFKLNNIWNEDYQVMPWYPMPMRNVSAYLSLSF